MFRSWLKGYGVIGLDRAAYPHRFSAAVDEQGHRVLNSGYLGTVATRDIKHREVILAVPLSLCITVDQVKYGFKRPNCAKSEGILKLTELGKLIETCPTLFSQSEQEDAENLVLTLFLMVETSKGKASRWYPYLQILNPIDELTDEPIREQAQTFFCDWDPAIIDEC